MKTRSKKKDPNAVPAMRDLERQIQELSRTVHLLDEARAHFADQYDFAPYGCLTLDERGCIVELNITAARLLGRDRARLVGMPFFPFVAKGHLPAFYNHLHCCKSKRDKCVTEIALAAKGRGS